MKKLLPLVAVSVLIAATPALARNPQGPAPGGRGSGGQCLPRILVDLPEEALDEQETASLRHMREEEKLSRDVYLAMDELWGLRIFSNIANAEQSHMNAVLTILDKYSIPDPVGDNPRGVFTDPDLQLLYDQFLDEGSDSIIDALIVGATIEDLDLSDLLDGLEQTDNLDVMMLYENLAKGSRNHLRGYVGHLSRNGESYVPQYIDETLYFQIITTPHERGVVDAYGETDPTACGRGPRMRIRHKRS